MSIEVVFLGTAASIPTVKRALPSVAVKRKDEVFMFDCGEGVQRQMTKARVGFHRKMKIFISHMHGDHVLGLPGLLQTMSLLDRNRKLEIYGPVGVKAFIEAVRHTVQFVLTFPVNVHEIEGDSVVCDEMDYYVESALLDHVIPNIAFALVEKPRPGKFDPVKAKSLGVSEGPLWSKLQHGHKVRTPEGSIVSPKQVLGPLRQGRKIVYSGDTKPAQRLVRLAEKADLLIHEATLDDELKEKAATDGHSTPSQAAEIAKKANVKKLVLTHVSSRYKDTEKLLQQARKIFPETYIAEDFLGIEVQL